MTAAPALQLRKRGGTRRRAPDRKGSTQLAAPPIEIVAPDRYRTAWLVEYAARRFPAEIVAGPGWIVRLQPPTGEGGGWVFELLVLVGRWLESARLPCASPLYANRSYVIRPCTRAAQVLAAGTVVALAAGSGSSMGYR